MLCLRHSVFCAYVRLCACVCAYLKMKTCTRKREYPCLCKRCGCVHSFSHTSPEHIDKSAVLGIEQTPPPPSPSPLEQHTHSGACVAPMMTARSFSFWSESHLGLRAVRLLAKGVAQTLQVVSAQVAEDTVVPLRTPPPVAHHVQV